MEKQQASDLCFYILMRTDLVSMNPGKGHAQAAHAQKQADGSIWRRVEYGTEWQARWRAWEMQTSQDFGTVIALGVDEARMRGVVDLARKAGFPAGVTHDPSYPVVDGAIVHLIPLDTCGWVFGAKEDLCHLLRQFSLCP